MLLAACSLKLSAMVNKIKVALGLQSLEFMFKNARRSFNMLLSFLRASRNI